MPRPPSADSIIRKERERVHALSNQGIQVQAPIATEMFLPNYSVAKNNQFINGVYVPYTGATGDVNLGAQNFTTTGTGTFGNIKLPSDSARLYLGASNDAYITYTGTALVFDFELDTTEIVFNESGFDTNFRVESDINAYGLHFDAGTSKLGINKQTVSYFLDVQGTSILTARFINTQNSSASAGAIMTCSSEDGAALGGNDRLGGFAFGGTKALNDPVIAAGIYSYADATWTSSSTPTRIAFETNATGVAATTTARMTIKEDGDVGINEAAPDYKLDVNGTFGFTPGTSVTPVDNGDVVIEATNNTTLTFKLKGSDGTVRSGTLTLA